jgi:hypothetical protein
MYSIFVNPYTGEVLGDRVERFSYYRFLLNLHYRLFISLKAIAPEQNSIFYYNKQLKPRQIHQ